MIARQLVFGVSIMLCLSAPVRAQEEPSVAKGNRTRGLVGGWGHSWRPIFGQTTSEITFGAFHPRMGWFITDRLELYGEATLFVYDEASQQFVRRTTNVKKENGDRAVGTQLAADHPAQTVLRRGQAYKGPAVLFGHRFYTAYQPVFGAAGKVIGIVYVGIPTANYTQDATGVWYLTFLVPVGAITFLIRRWQLVSKTAAPTPTG